MASEGVAFVAGCVAAVAFCLFVEHKVPKLIEKKRAQRRCPPLFCCENPSVIVYADGSLHCRCEELPWRS